MVGVTPEEAPIQDTFAAAVSAAGVAVDSVSAERPAAGETEECPDLVSVTVSGTGRDGADAEVRLVAGWSGDALRDVRCEGPSCLSSVQGPYTVFQVTGDGESAVMYQPAEGGAGGAAGQDAAGCAGEDLQVDEEAFPGDSMPEDGPRGLAAYEGAEECAAAVAAAGVATSGAWVVRSSGGGPAGEELLQLAAVEYWAELLPPR
jgi:hypothetical protein